MRTVVTVEVLVALRTSGRLLVSALASLFLIGVVADAQRKPAVARIPQNVMNTLNAKFPGAAIDKWTKEKELGRELYDIEFRQNGRKLEADIFTDGTIHNWEREIAVKDVPAAVMDAVGRKYPKATVKQAMAITAVTDGKEALEGYELLVVTASKRQIEITVAPDGRILEAGAAE